jgi:hypothetical protein
VDDFIALAIEIIADDLDDVEEHIIKHILEAYNDEEEEDADEDGSDEPIRKITLNKAIEAMKIRILYEEQYADDEGEKLLQLERDLRQLSLQKQASNTKQASLFDYFK